MGGMERACVQERMTEAWVLHTITGGGPRMKGTEAETQLIHETPRHWACVLIGEMGTQHLDRGGRTLVRAKCDGWEV